MFNNVLYQPANDGTQPATSITVQEQEALFSRRESDMMSASSDMLGCLDDDDMMLDLQQSTEASPFAKDDDSNVASSSERDVSSPAIGGLRRALWSSCVHDSAGVLLGAIGNAASAEQRSDHTDTAGSYQQNVPDCEQPAYVDADSCLERQSPQSTSNSKVQTP